MFYMTTNSTNKRQPLGSNYFEAKKTALRYCAQNEIDVTFCDGWNSLMIFHPTCDIEYVRVNQLSPYLRGFMPTFFERLAQ